MMPNSDIPTPDTLSPRQHMPQGWRWHVFRNNKGQRLRFGTVSPRGSVPDAVVVGLPGLSEFSEKYFEVAHDLLDRNLAFWVLDWQAQGKSDRPCKNPHRRHAHSFDDDIDDLHFFLMEYVKHASIHPDVGRIPMVMLAHSMGGNIGLRYLMKYPGMFAAAAFSAPMCGIASLSKVPLALPITEVLNLLMGSSYIFGGRNWTPDARTDPKRNVFSRDAQRAQVHNAWSVADPALRVGDVTFGWVYAAMQSCAALRHDLPLNPPEIPCLFALAGDDTLVDNTVTRDLAKHIKESTILDLPGSLHEILMEKDDIRNSFWAALEDMLKKHNIRDQLKPF